MASRATSAAASAASSAWTCAQSPPFAPPPEGPARRAPAPAGPRRSPRSPPRSARPAWRTPGSNPARRGPCPLPRLQLLAPRAAPGHRPGPQEPGAVPGMARLRASAVRLAAPPVVLADAAAPEVADRGQPGVQPGPAGLQLGQRRSVTATSVSGCLINNQTTPGPAATPSTYVISLRSVRHASSRSRPRTQPVSGNSR